MSAGATFTVTPADRRKLRNATRPLAAMVAMELAAAAAAGTPESKHGKSPGALRHGWYVTPGWAPGAWVVANDVPYGRHVELGTQFIRPVAMFARAIAATRSRYGAR